MTEITLDVRAIQPQDRHRTVFEAFDRLPLGGAVILSNDHDPRALFHQMTATRAGELDWTYLESGPEWWRVRIGRVALAPTERGASCCGCCGG